MIIKYWNIISDPARWQNFAQSEFGKGFITALCLILAFMLLLLVIRGIFKLIFRSRRCSAIEVFREDGSTMVNREVISSVVDRELAAYPAVSAEKILLTRKGSTYQLTVYCTYLLSDQSGIPAFCDEFKPKLRAVLEKGFGITTLEQIRFWICNPEENGDSGSENPPHVQEKDAYIGL
ncbi:MAG: hypothetical protein J6S54_05420 [Lentisphaeria bacterium]|nr:hypothetical protein [Lentisphaeria bacterium]